MKILFHRPEWANRWLPYLDGALLSVGGTYITSTQNGEELESLSSQADVLVSAWANEVVEYWTHKFPEKKIVTYLRRYEIDTPRLMASINWDCVDKVIFVSEQIRQRFLDVLGDTGRTELIPNAVDLDRFSYRQRKPGTKIAMVCTIKDVKNFPLAAQIVMKLPDHRIHHIGLPTDNCGINILRYLDHLGVMDRFSFEGTIDPDDVSDWLEDKDYLLSTSMMEGNPNNVIEAMAKGIKPVIHNWMGASRQFPNECIFNTVDQAVGLLTEDSYDSQRYRSWTQERYSLDNFKRVAEIVAAI
jgi:glycosyltransferase involved in cell wall biosynthesis